MSIFTSAASEWPSSAALSAAISSEMAMSPATPGVVEGNDNTSVGLFLLRKRRFSAFISRFEVMPMLTSPAMPRACCTRVAKRLKVSALVAFEAGGLRVTLAKERMGGRTALPQYGSKVLFGNAIPARQIRGRNLRQRGFAVRIRGVAGPIHYARRGETGVSL